VPRRSSAHPEVTDDSRLWAAAEAVVRTSVDLRSPEAADAVADLAGLTHDLLVAAGARRARP